MLPRRLTLIIVITLAAFSIGCASLAAPTATPAPPTPNIEATVKARVQNTLAAMPPTPTPGPMFTPSQAIAIVQQYLKSKTYVKYSSPFLGLPQTRSVHQCRVLEDADWQAVHQRGTWIVTREMDWGEYAASPARAPSGGIGPSARADVQVDEWTLNEHTRVVKRLGADSEPFASSGDC